MRCKPILLLSVLAIAVAACQQPANSNKEASDSTTIYGNPTDTGRGQGDSVIDRGMGDTTVIQSGGSKTNVGSDTVGKQPHDH